LRWQPEDLDMDWLLKGYFDRLDEDAVVGQAAGIRPGRNVSGPDPTFYRDSDITEAVRDAMRIFPGDPVSAEAYVASRVARNLDKRPRRGDYNLEGDTKNDRWGVSLTGEIEFDGAVLRSVTSYDGYDRERTGEGDFTPHSRFDLASFDDGWQLYQELMLSDQAEETPVRWEIGAYYLMEKIDFRGFNTSGATAGARTYLQDTWSVAAFAGGEWDFLDGFTLEAGIRFNWTRKTFDHEILSLVEHPKDRPEVQWEAPTGTIALRYALAKDVSVYWKYARGWKPGTYNSVTNPARDVTAAEPESIDSWEVGLRGAFFEGRLQLGVSAFYYRYQDYQVFVVVSDGQTIPQNQIENASDAQVYGAELDFQLEPLGGFVPLEIDGLRLTGRFGWLENQYLDFTVESITSVQRPGAGGGVVTLSSARVNQYSGNRLAYSPEFSFSMNTAWPVDLHRYGVITPSYDLIWNDAIYFGPGEGKGQLGGRSGRTVLPKYQVGQKPVALHHVRLAYRPVQHVEVAGWIRNLTDETVRTQGFDAAGRGVSVSYVGEPRTYGLDVSFSW
jgi:outer membrane receptor protein involved in Fe transport